MSRRKTGDRFRKELEGAKRPAEVYGYHATEYHKALSSGLSEKDARGEASRGTAAKYGISRRQVENIVGAGRNSWAAKEQKLIEAANADYAATGIERRAAVLRWLRPEELREAGIAADVSPAAIAETLERLEQATRTPLAELALRAMPRANARVTALETALRETEEREKQVVAAVIARCGKLEGRIRELESALKKAQTRLAAAEASNPFSAKRNPR